MYGLIPHKKGPTAAKLNGPAIRRGVKPVADLCTQKPKSEQTTES